MSRSEGIQIGIKTTIIGALAKGKAAMVGGTGYGHLTPVWSIDDGPGSVASRRATGCFVIFHERAHVIVQKRLAPAKVFISLVEVALSGLRALREQDFRG
jgi:hypothetical protein